MLWSEYWPLFWNKWPTVQRSVPLSWEGYCLPSLNIRPVAVTCYNRLIQSDRRIVCVWWMVITPRHWSQKEPSYLHPVQSQALLHFVISSLICDATFLTSCQRNGSNTGVTMSSPPFCNCWIWTGNSAPLSFLYMWNSLIYHWMQPKSLCWQ